MWKARLISHFNAQKYKFQFGGAPVPLCCSHESEEAQDSNSVWNLIKAELKK